MRLRTALAALLFLLPACASVPQPSRLRFVDLTPDFARVADSTAALPDAERTAAFKSAFASILPGFYTEARIGAPAGVFDPYLLKALKAWPEQRSGVEEVSRRFSAMMAPALAGFEAQFGPMTGYPPVYLVHSLGEFDGGTRTLPEGLRLLFGADVIARLHLAHDIRPFFHHELFHLYHARTFPECDAVWCNLWSEGLAVYVSQRLNPKATDAEMVLTEPEPIRPTVDRNRKTAFCTVLAKLDSTARQDNGALFSSGRLGQALPPRAGYYVGYLVAAELGRTRSLRQLAKLGHDDVRPLLAPTLRTLDGGCP